MATPIEDRIRNAGGTVSPESRGAEMAQLARSKDISVRLELASAMDTPLGALIVLSQDKKSAVRAAVAGNPAIVNSGTLVATFTADKDADVHLGLISNLAVSDDVIRHLSVEGKSKVREAALARLAE